MGELTGELFYQPAGGRTLITGSADLLLEEDFDRALGPHHSDFCRRPRQVNVTPDVLRAHDVVRPAVCLSGDDGELWYRCLAIGVEQLGSVLDDAAVLLSDPRQEAGNVHEGDHW